MTREPYTGWDVDPLAVPEPDPEPPRRLGCSVFVLALLILGRVAIEGVGT